VHSTELASGISSAVRPFLLNRKDETCLLVTPSAQNRWSCFAARGRAPWPTRKKAAIWTSASSRPDFSVEDSSDLVVELLAVEVRGGLAVFRCCRFGLERELVMTLISDQIE